MRAHLTRVLTFALIGCLVALALLVSDRYLPALPNEPAKLPPAVVTLGDSTLSGEGAGHYVPGTDGQGGNWCHRSPQAVVDQIPLPPGVTPINIACSGAKATDIGTPNGREQAQAQQLVEIARHYRITAVVVQLGANDDPGFTDLVNRCVGAWGSRVPGGCSQQLRDQWPRRLERMRPKVLAAQQQVRTAMNNAGYTPAGYQLVLQSYAAPVGPGVAPQLQNLSGCPFQNVDLQWIQRSAVPQLSQALHQVAEQSGARFLDLSQAGRGHGACSGGNAHPDQEWFTRLTVDWDSLGDDARAQHAMQASFHPNARGAAEFARCLGEFLASTGPEAACEPDGGGHLRLATDTAAARSGPPR